MKILLTGASSGLGAELSQRLAHYDLQTPTRAQLDLANVSQVRDYSVGYQDMIINCAGTGKGGKISFVDHRVQDMLDIINVNLTSPVLLVKKALAENPNCRIVNVTSTNNNRYWPNDLAYSLSKKALGEFGQMLRVEYPEIDLLEVRLGLTKTNFNRNRYVNDPERYSDIYQNKHLTVNNAVDRIMTVLFDPAVKFIEVSP